MKSIFATMLLALTVGAPSLFADDAAGRGDLLAHSFRLQHKATERAASVIEPLMSADGTVSIQPSTRTLVVTDRPENIKAIRAALDRYDAPPQPFVLTLKLVSASRSSAPSPVAPDLREVAAKLGGVLRFNNFEKLGELRVSAREGSPIIGQTLAPDYRADFVLGEWDPASDTIRVESFDLRRGSNGQLDPVLKTTLNLKVGQTVVLGASRDPNSQKALMLVAVATRE